MPHKDPEKRREYQKAYRQRPEIKEKRSAYQRVYWPTYWNKPEVKEQSKIRSTKYRRDKGIPAIEVKGFCLYMVTTKQKMAEGILKIGCTKNFKDRMRLLKLEWGGEEIIVLFKSKTLPDGMKDQHVIEELRRMGINPAYKNEYFELKHRDTIIKVYKQVVKHYEKTTGPESL